MEKSANILHFNLLNQLFILIGSEEASMSILLFILNYLHFYLTCVLVDLLQSFQLYYMFTVSAIAWQCHTHVKPVRVQVALECV